VKGLYLLRVRLSWEVLFEVTQLLIQLDCRSPQRHWKSSPPIDESRNNDCQINWAIARRSNDCLSPDKIMEIFIFHQLIDWLNN